MNRFATAMARALRRDEGGSIAVEFALVAPIVMFILAGVVDIGSATFVKRALDARITAAAGYALLQLAPGDGQTAQALAERLAGLLQGVSASEIAEVDVNNAARAESTGTVVSVAAGAGDVAMCYCPTLAQGALVWGPAVDCESPCAGGESAGKFVQLRVAARYVSVFPGNFFGEEDRVVSRAVLGLQ